MTLYFDCQLKGKVMLVLEMGEVDLERFNTLIGIKFVYKVEIRNLFRIYLHLFSETAFLTLIFFYKNQCSNFTAEKEEVYNVC